MRGMPSFVSIPDNHKSPELIGLKEVMRRVQRSRSTIYRWIDRGIFPRQANKGTGTTSALWFSDEVDAFIEKLRDTPCESRTSPLSLAPHLCSTKVRPMSQSAKLLVKPNKPLFSNKRPVGNNSRPCFILGASLIGTQEAFFDPRSGKVFVLIGQLPIAPLSPAPQSVQKHWHADEAGGEQ
jgi:predicted DNA-binding transcriptional regulator AlpA